MCCLANYWRVGPTGAERLHGMTRHCRLVPKAVVAFGVAKRPQQAGASRPTISTAADAGVECYSSCRGPAFPATLESGAFPERKDNALRFLSLHLTNRCPRIHGDRRLRRAIRTVLVVPHVCWLELAASMWNTVSHIRHRPDNHWFSNGSLLALIPHLI